MRAIRFTLTQTYQGEWILGVTLRKESVRDAMNLCDCQNGDYDITIKKHHPKRSLSANAYFHVLCGKLAEVLNSDINEIKRMLVCRYGVVEASAQIRLPKGINPDDFYPYTMWIGGDDETNTYVLFKQTHKMNSAEFARLINCTIEECHTLGIETLSEDELRRLYAQADTLHSDSKKR